MAASVVPPTAEGSGTYTYSSQPRAVQQRQKFRDQSQYNNIMYDHRIVRGNTYALHTLPASSQPDPLELQRQQESRRRSLARKRAREQLRPRSPEPVEGRKHIEVQTELYLEEITDRVEEADIQTQTDAFLDRPPTPLFVPAKTGVDVSTQIVEGDLFDFNLEVKPILEVLVGKTVEQALLEVMEEEELASLRAQQREFEENRNAEVVETQRLDEQERRRREEKERRLQQQREALLKEKETAEKIAARAFAQSYLSDLVPSVFNTLKEHGFFYDPVEREVETAFMPWLMDEAVKALEKTVLARAMVDVIIRDIIAKRLGVPVFEPPTSSENTVTEAEPTSEEGTAPATEPLGKVFGEKDDSTPSQPATDPEVQPAADPPPGTTQAPAEITEPPTDETTVKPPADPPSDPPADPPSDPPADPSSDPPADPPSDPPADPSSDPPAEPPSDPPAEPPSDPTAEPPSDPAAEPPSDKSAEPPSDLPAEPPSDLPAEPPSDPPAEPPSDLPAEPPSDPPAEPPSDLPAEPPSDLPAEPPSDLPTEPAPAENKVETLAEPTEVTETPVTEETPTTETEEKTD